MDNALSTSLASTPDAPRRILLIKPSSLGDIIHALPVLNGLRQRFPTAEIDWLIGSAFAPLLEGHPQINELISFDRRRYGTMLRSPRAAVAFLQFIRALRRRRYDMVIDLQGLFRSGFLCRVSRARTRVGFAAAREGAWLFYNRKLRPPPTVEHAVDRNYTVSDLLGFRDTPIEFPLPIAEAERDAAADLLREGGWTPSRPLVAFVPGARWETKVWLPERFSAVIDELQNAPADAPNDQPQCVLLGGPDEAALCARIAAGCRSAPINLAGRTSLRQLPAVLDRAGVVLCHDSAAMHLAVALKRPLVCLTGPTNPRRTGPYKREEDVVRLDLPCSPCYFRCLRQCPHDHRCMKDLTVEMVLDALRKRLRNQSAVPALHGTPSTV